MNELPDDLQAQLRAFAVRWRRIQAARAAGFSVLFALSWLLGVCMLDRALALQGILRLLLAGTGVIGAISLATILYGRRFIQIDWIASAGQIDHLLSLEQRLRTVTSQWLLPPQLRASPALLEFLHREVISKCDASAP